MGHEPIINFFNMNTSNPEGEIPIDGDYRAEKPVVAPGAGEAPKEARALVRLKVQAGIPLNDPNSVF